MLPAHPGMSSSLFGVCISVAAGADEQKQENENKEQNGAVISKEIAENTSSV
jgi:hypothetical protein